MKSSDTKFTPGSGVDTAGRGGLDGHGGEHEAVRGGHEGGGRGGAAIPRGEDPLGPRGGDGERHEGGPGQDERGGGQGPGGNPRHVRDLQKFRG